MFFKKKNKLTSAEKALRDKLSEIRLIQTELEELVAEIVATNKVIAILPNGADKDAEIEFCGQQKFSLLVAIGKYDCARQEYFILCNKIDDETNAFLMPPSFIDTSHEILRKFFQKTPWQINQSMV